MATPTETTLVHEAPPPPPPRPPREFGWEWALAILLVLAAAGAAFLFLRHRDHTTAQPATTTAPARPLRAVNRTKVPPLTGVQLATARIELGQARLHAVVLKRTAAKAAPGIVLGQRPRAGTPEKPGSSVTVVVAAGRPAVKLPDLVGMPAAAAVKTLTALHLGSAIRIGPASRKKPGTVAAQQPAAGTRAKPGTRVQLVVTKAAPKPVTTTQTTTVVQTTTAQATPAPAPAPAAHGNDYRGMRLADAVRRIAQGRQQVIVTYVTSTRPAGIVVANAPSGGKEQLQVSKGTAAVPAANATDETGNPSDQARSELQAAGFTVLVVQWPVSDPTLAGTVTYQTPTGTQPRGATIVLYVGASG